MESHEGPTGLTQEGAQQVQTLKQEVAAESAEQIKADFLEVAAKAAEMKRLVENTIRQERTVDVRFEGSKDDKNSQKGKAVTVKEAVQKILLTAKTPEKTPSSPDHAQIVPSLIKRVAENIDPERVEIPEIAAPYLYEFLQGVIEGRIKSIDALAREFGNLDVLAATSPGLYHALQESLVTLAIEQGESVSAAKEKFKVESREELEEEEIDPWTRQKIRKQVVFTPEEDRQLRDFSYRISQKLSYKDADLIMESLRSGAMTEDIEHTLSQEVKLSSPEIETLRRLTGKTAKYIEYSGGQYPGFEESFPAEEREKFTFDYLRNHNYLDKDGVTPEGKRELRKSALRAVNKLLEVVDREPGVEFEKIFSEFHEGYLFRDIKKVIENLIKDPRFKTQYGDYEAYDNVRYWLIEGLSQEVGREKELRSLYHNVGIWIKMMQPKQLSEHMAQHNVSEATYPVVSDISGKLVALALNEYERYIQFDIFKNNGEVKPRLGAGKYHDDPHKLYYSAEDDDVLRQRFEKTIRRLGEYTKTLTPDQQKDLESYGLTRYDIENLQNVDFEWEIERALKYAKGIHLTQTIRAYELIASTRPRQDFLGSSNNFFDLAGNLNPSWKWTLGRGNLGPRLTHTKEFLVTDLLVRKPKESLIARLFEPWKPNKLHEESEKFNELKLSENWARMKDSWLYQDMSFRQLINKFSTTSGLYGRAGWRTGGIKELEYARYVAGIQDAVKKELEKDWEKRGFKREFEKEEFGFGDGHWTEIYKSLSQIIGVGSRYWFDGERAAEYVKKELWDKLKINPKVEAKSTLDRLWSEYTDGKHGGDAILTAPGGEKMTVKDLMEIRTLVLQGMNFYDLLRRSPLDFLNNLGNIQKDLMPKNLGGSKEDLFFECFAGDSDNPRLANEKELQQILEARRLTGKELIDKKEQILIFQRELKRYWGEDNFKHIIRIRDFYKRLETWGKEAKDKKDQFRFLADGKKDGKFDKDKMFEFFFRELDFASEKVKLRKGEIMNPEDIEDIDIRDFFFGKEGLISYFKNLVEDPNDPNKKLKVFGEVEKGKDVGLGERGFFYHMARSWYNEIGTNIHPNTSDVDWRFILHNVGDATGETLVRRLWGDMAQWNEVMNKLMDLDHILARVATSHDLSEILDLHRGIHQIEGISGKHAMYEAQFYLAQLVARYFQEDSATRSPLFLGSLYRLFMGRQSALSKIHNGMGAMVMTSDGQRSYFEMLANLHFIDKTGQFGVGRLGKTVGADYPKIVIETSFNILQALALFLGWKFLSKALEEAEGRKK